MNAKNFIIIVITFISLIVAATIVTFALNPQMHKSFVFEQIIFKRGK